jgi:hypothetical protein
MKWLLIMTLITTRGVTMDKVEGIESEEKCKIVGEAWKAGFEVSRPTWWSFSAHYVCIPQTKALA